MKNKQSSKDISIAIDETRVKLLSHFDPRVTNQFEMLLQQKLEEYFKYQRQDFQRENRNTPWQDEGLQLEMDIPVTFSIFGKFQEIYNPQAFINLLNQLTQVMKLAPPDGQQTKYLSQIRKYFKCDIHSSDKEVVHTFLEEHANYVSLAEESQKYLLNLFDQAIKGSEVVEHRPKFVP